MPADLTIAGGPIFASRSRINADSRDYGTLVASSGNVFLPRIVDGDPESFWQSDTGVDGISEVIEVSVQTRSALVPKSIDILALQNMNFRRFIVEYKSGGGAYATIPGADFTGSDFSGSDFIVAFSPVTADFIRITATHTQGGPDNKRLGGAYACLQTVQMTQGHLSRYEKRYREQVRSVILGDGSETQERVMRSAASYFHYGATATFELVSQAERDALLGIKRSGEPFTFIPEPFDLKRDIYTCRFDGPWADRYHNNYKGAGYTLDLNVREVGDL